MTVTVHQFHDSMRICKFCDDVIYSILVGKKIYHFEYYDMFGPLVIDKNGNEASEPMPRSRFWTAVSLWNLQGKQHQNGECIWHKPKQPVIEKRESKYFITEDGDPGWDW